MLSTPATIWRLPMAAQEEPNHTYVASGCNGAASAAVREIRLPPTTLLLSSAPGNGGICIYLGAVRVSSCGTWF